MKTCYVAGCDRGAGWIYHDEEYGDMDSCADHAGYDHWEAMQAEYDTLVAPDKCANAAKRAH